ncbi:MAG: choice-of-anchor L domain-containing protein [Bacteroidota bacterium]
MKNRKKEFYLIALCCLSFLPLQAQLYVDPSISVEQMVMDFFDGNCVDISNVTYQGVDQAKGYFEAANTDLDITGGILLTTGAATSAIGPNDSPNTNNNNDTGGDASLDSIASGATIDACVLEFDLVSHLTDTIYFSYLFGSEEYPEFTCSQFNDVFGFFQSGPDPLGGMYVDHNIAMVPDSADPSGLTYTHWPVAINTINPGVEGSGSGGAAPYCFPPLGSLDFSHFYMPSDTGTNLHAQLQYDGFTIKLLAPMIVQANATYHVKIAIADVFDWQYDSGIFLGVESLCGESEIEPPAEAELTTSGNTVAIENLSRYATSYLWDFGDGITSTERHPDPHLYPEAGQYTLTLITQNFCCSDTLVASIDIASDMAVDTSICAADYVLNGNVPGSGEQGQWEILFGSGALDDAALANATLTNPSEGYNILVWTIIETSTGMLLSADTLVVGVANVPLVDIITEYDQLCTTYDPVEMIATPIGGVYSGTGIMGDFFDPSIAGTGLHEVTYTYTSIDGCAAQDQITIEVNMTPFVEILTDLENVCQNGEAIALVGSPSGGSFTGAGVSDNILFPDMAPMGPFTIEYHYTDINGCDGLAQFDLMLIPEAPTPEILVSADTLTCSIIADDYIWYLDGNPLSISGPQIPLTFNGAYSVQILQNGCLSEISPALFLTGLDDLSGQGDPNFIIQPNPANDFVQIQLLQDDGVEVLDAIRLYNIHGQLLQQRTDVVNEQGIDLDVSHLPKGVYYLVLGVGSQIQGVSFVKQ